MRYCPQCGFDHDAATPLEAREPTPAPATPQAREVAAPRGGWNVGSIVLVMAASALVAAIGGLVYFGILSGAGDPALGIATPTPELADPTPSAASTRTPSPAAPRTTPTSHPETPQPAATRIRVDLAFSGPHGFTAREELPESVTNECSFTPVPSDPSQFVVDKVYASLPINASGATADFLYTDIDGPGETLGSASLAIPDGFSTQIYLWSGNGYTIAFGSPEGTIEYSSDLREMTFDLSMRLDIGSPPSRLTGTVTCPPYVGDLGSTGAGAQTDGQTYSMGTHSVTIAEVKDWTGLLPPASGNKYVAIKLVIESVDGSPIYTFAHKLRDAQGTEYLQSLIGEQPHVAQIGSLATGEKYTGWMTFEIPRGASALTVLYQSGIGAPVVEMPLD